MSLSLKKGQKLNLSKEHPNLENILIGLGWQTNNYDGSADFDLDASAFLLDVNNKAKEKDFIFYGNLKHASGSVIHSGDNLVGGSGMSDDEQIRVSLSKLPAGVEKVAITVTIYEAKKRKQSFGMVNNAFIRIVDANTDKEILRYDLTDDYSVETAMVIAELYKKGGDWRFSAVGSGYHGGLQALCSSYGLDVDGE